MLNVNVVTRKSNTETKLLLKPGKSLKVSGKAAYIKGPVMKLVC